MERENQRIALTKRLLKEALLRLLKEKEIGRISVTTLCQEAQVNRATFYRHYQQPRDVLLDIEMELLEGAKECAPLPTGPEGSRMYLEKLFAYIYGQADIVRVLIRTNTDDDLVRFLISCNDTILAAKLRTADGQMPDENDRKLLAAYLGGGGYHMLRAWLLDGMDKTPEEVARFIFELGNRELKHYSIAP